MDIPNAFIGRKKAPPPDELDNALGAAAPLWHGLVYELAERGAGYCEWQAVAQKYGWSLRVKRNKRTIVQLSPCKGCFQLLFVFDERAIEAAPQYDLPKDILKQIDAAPYLSEGSHLRLLVRQQSDMPTVLELVALKLKS